MSDQAMQGVRSESEAWRRAAVEREGERDATREEVARLRRRVEELGGEKSEEMNGKRPAAGAEGEQEAKRPRVEGA